MSEGKHTKGPWEVRPFDGGLGCIVANCGETLDGVDYQVYAPNLVPDKDVSANARLIAAAPDMYEALRIIREALSHTRGAPKSVHNLADAALRLAEGGAS